MHTKALLPEMFINTEEKTALKANPCDTAPSPLSIRKIFGGQVPGLLHTVLFNKR